MRVLQAPSNIANQAWHMAEGLRALGHEVSVWQYGDSGFDFSADRHIETGKDPAVYVRTLVEALEQGFDVVHFHFARSLIPARGGLPWFWDLPVWRALGVKIVFTFHGTDVRLRSHHIVDDQWSFYRFGDVPCDEELVEARLSVIRRYAHHMTVGSVLDQPYVPEAVYVPRTVDTDRIRPLTGVAPNPRPVVMHAPSRRSTKGTDLILAGLDTLRDRGVDFDVDLVEGLGHAELMQRMARADVVVEKVLNGDAGVTSLEAMALGRVAVARIRPQVLDAHPDLPVVSADPDSFVEVMTGLLTDDRRRAEIGAAGRAFVERDRSPRVVGRRLEELYQKPGRRGATSPEGWTVPAPQAKAEAWRDRMERAETAHAATKEKLKAARRRVRRLERRLEELGGGSDRDQAH